VNIKYLYIIDSIKEDLIMKIITSLFLNVFLFSILCPVPADAAGPGSDTFPKAPLLN
jgi:hypothetical protein